MGIIQLNGLLISRLERLQWSGEHHSNGLRSHRTEKWSDYTDAQWAKYTADSLEQMILEIQKKGFQIVPVSELIYYENDHMDEQRK